MSTLSPASPFSRAATIAALLPLPQASVSPTPRSHTRSSIRSRSSILATPKFTRAGKAILLSSGSELTVRVDAWLVPQVNSGQIAEQLERALAAAR